MGGFLAFRCGLRRYLMRGLLTNKIFSGLLMAITIACAAGSTQADIYVECELVVGLSDGCPIDSINSQFGTSLAQHLPQLDVYLLNAPASVPLDSLASEIMSHPSVVFCHPNYLVDPLGPVQGSLPFGDDLGTGDYAGQPAATTLSLGEAHNFSMGDNVSIAVIDGGVNYQHPALSDVAQSGWDYVDDDPDAFDEPGGGNSGHGTFVAGVVHLVSPNSQIKAYRVTDTAGESNGYIVAEAILQAVDDGCRVINLSMVMTAQHDAIHYAINYARQNNVLVIVAAGNGQGDQGCYPASDTSAIAVAAVDSAGHLAEFSNFGDYVDLCAPGVEIYAPFTDSSYAWWGGTSFSAPFVSAQAALLISMEPSLTWSEVLDAILSTAVNIDSLNGGLAGQLGAGFIDPVASLMALFGAGITVRVPDDYATIQEAIDAAYHGDTVLVAPGIYYECLDFNGKSIKLISEESADATIIHAGSVDCQLIRMVGSYLSGIEIIGFTFSGGRSSDHTIEVDGASPLITNCIFHHNNPDSASTNPILNIRNSAAIITNNLFYDNGGYGGVAIASGTNGCRVINNTFDNNNYGITIASSNSSLSDRVVANNIITNSWSVGLRGSGSSSYMTCDYNNVWNNAVNYDWPNWMGDHDLSVDPLYIDTAQRNYRLHPSSPCVDAGHPDPIYNDPDGTPADMGAFVVGYANPPLAVGARATPADKYRLVTTLTPTITWSYYDTLALTQDSYEIQIGTDHDWTVAEIWDTGPVTSSDTTVLYAGPALSDYTIYYGRIRVRDISAWGDWTYFSFGTSTGNVINVPSDVTKIQTGIDFANDGDTVLVAPGTYTDRVVFHGKSIAVVSSGGPDVTIIDVPAPDSTSILFNAAEDSATVFSGFTVQNGYVNIAVGNLSNPVITGNKILNATRRGLFSTKSDGVRIESNLFEGNSYAMRVEYGTELIYNNLIVNNGPDYEAVGLRGGINTEFIGNIVARNACEEALQVTQGQNIVVRNNTFYGNAERAIDLLWARSLDIRNNIFAFHPNGSGIRDHDSYPGSTPVIEYNCFFANYPVDLERLIDGTGCIFEDPLFEDTSANTFELLPGSPCIDAGDPDSLYNDSDNSRGDMGTTPRLASGYPIAAGINYAPIGPGGVVSSLTPDIFWSYLDTAATTPTQHEIEVGTDLDWSVAEMWASGPVASSDTTAIYAGSPVSDFTTYYVRIRVNNGTAWGEWTTAVMTIKTTHVINVPGDLPTIEGALLVAVDGDSVLVAPGTYAECAFFRGKKVVVTATGGPDVTFLEPLQSYRAAISFNGGEDTTSVVEGFTFQNGNAYIEIVLHAGPKITGNRFVGGLNCAVYAMVPTGLIVRNNVFDGNKRDITTYRGRVTIQNNILKNGVEGTGYDAINLDLPERGEVSYNQIVNNTFGDYSDCLEVRRADSCFIINNTITGNTCVGDTIGAINLLEVTYARVYNNIVAFNTGMYGIEESETEGSVDLAYNDVFANTLGDYAGTTPGTGSISADPLFLDAPNLDYSLTSASPCIDAGHPSLIYLDPNGSRNDMGAIPYNGILDPPVPLFINMSPEDMSHVASSTPTIYWSFYDTLGSQEAYEIEVGTDDDWAQAEMWSTGTVSSSDTSAVYAGNSMTGGTDYYLRMKVSNGTNWGGWRSGLFHKNAAPGVPVLYLPINDYPASSGSRLKVIAPEDLESDPLTFQFEIYGDSNLTLPETLLYSEYVTADTGYSQPIPELETDRQYWWRARAHDGYEYSQWSPPESFTLIANVTVAQVSVQGPTDEVYCDGEIEFVLRITNSYENNIIGISNGFVVYSPDGASFTSLTGEWYETGNNWNSIFDLFHGVAGSADGGPPRDSISFGACTMFSDGFPPNDSRDAFIIRTTVDCADTGKTICLDSTFFLPAGPWLWYSDDVSNNEMIPAWDGPYCFTISKCCLGMRGNVNGDGENCNVADLSCLVDYLFRGGPALCCPQEANVDGSPNDEINIADLTYLVDYLFKGGDEPFACGSYTATMPLKAATDREPHLRQIVANDTTIIILKSDRQLRGIQLDLVGPRLGDVTRLTGSEFDMPHHQTDSTTVVGILDLDGDYVLPPGETPLLKLPGKHLITYALASDMTHHAIILGVKVENGQPDLPEAFALYPNYPNPFNPATVIGFDVPHRSHVKLEIFNILGQRVNVLRDEEMAPGHYDIYWPGTNDRNKPVATGVYFYRLQTEEFIDTRKMILIK